MRRCLIASAMVACSKKADVEKVEKECFRRLHVISARILHAEWTVSLLRTIEAPVMRKACG